MDDRDAYQGLKHMQIIAQYDKRTSPGEFYEIWHLESDSTAP
jgi:hypothetical protein